ncbi:MAG: hypothetical protein II889_13710 [Clostridia bacterium]|nr:hypothetical protein [Clostridia bacterium]MCR4905544.1 hypothetical protein [Clostridiales bacterium]
MTRGAEKRIFHVKDPKSPYFEEAWFVMRRGAGKRRGLPTASSTLAEEADRIIRACEAAVCPPKASAPIHRLPPPLAFALGAASSSAVIGTVALIVGLA